MKTIHVILLTAFAAGFAAFAPAIGKDDGENRVITPSGGVLRTMPHGTYQCVLPGDASGAAYIEVAEESFRIFTASRYESSAGSGTYILRGSDLVFTRGPKKDQKFQRVGDNQLRKLSDDGAPSDLLCTRLGAG